MGSSASATNQLRIRHLRLVETLVSAGSLHKAATELHLSQPAASAMLQEVEGALGAKLFDRTHKGVTLTARGTTALARLRAVLVELGMIAKELDSDQSLPIL